MSGSEIHQRQESYTRGEMPVLAYLLMGGNIGDVPQSFEKAVQYLNDSDINTIRKSKIYQSEPWGFEADSIFYNQLLEVKTILNPFELLDELLRIELELGRVRKNSMEYTSRIIDLDILFYGEEIIKHQRLTIPHPRISERMFALKPLAELIPNYQHPELNKSIEALLAECKDEGKVWAI